MSGSYGGVLLGRGIENLESQNSIKILVEALEPDF
jgi:hypothetical protein